MNKFTVPTNDIELGDFPARKEAGWANLAWIITHHCTLGCPYCVGWKSKTPVPTLIDVLGSVDNVVSALEKFRDVVGKHVYITISGGEPTLVKQLPELCKKLTDRKFIIELHSNLTTSGFVPFIDTVDLKYVSQVTATYHPWKLEKVPAAKNLYMRNYEYGIYHGLTSVLKTVAVPGDMPVLESRLANLRKEIPASGIILPWVYIERRPESVTKSAGAYPQAYSKDDRKILERVMRNRWLCQSMYMNGAGFFKGMLCDAGRSYFYMDIHGNIFPCYSLKSAKNRIGTLGGEITPHKSTCPCPLEYCGTPFWGMWYGENPWDYVPGFTKSSSYYNRFGLSCKECYKGSYIDYI